MNITGMLHGARLLKLAGFPTPDILGPDASESEIKALIAKHGQVFIKRVFKGGVGKKGKAGLPAEQEVYFSVTDSTHCTLATQCRFVT